MDAAPYAVERKSSLPVQMAANLKALLPNLTSLLPADIALDQFRAALFLELTGRPDLAECTPESVRDCVVKSATYGLLPGRDVHFLPFRNKRKGGKKDATYVPNYLGIILALERSGKVRRAFAHPVYEGDEWGFDYFADRPLHKPALSLGKAQGKILFYYGAILMKDGTCHFEVLTLNDMDAVKKRAASHEDGPWVTDPVMMARKTALKRVAKYVKVTPAVQDMLVEDEAREQGDISAERHAKNISDLFGDGAPLAIQQGASTVNLQTGEIATPASHPIWTTIAHYYDEAGRPEEYAEFQTWACKQYRVSHIQEIRGEYLAGLAAKVYAALEPTIKARQATQDAPASLNATQDDSQDLAGDQGPSWNYESPNLMAEEDAEVADRERE